MKVFAGVVAASALLMAGCQPSVSEIEKAKEAVADKLRDPGSAQFRNVKEGDLTSNLNPVCGEVNGKNAFGGYTGYQRFITNNEGRIIYLETQWPAEQFETMWVTDCPNS